jgi:hypothetical protein
MLFKFIEKYLETELLIGKPVPFHKIVLLTPNNDLFASVSKVFMERMWKLTQND